MKNSKRQIAARVLSIIAIVLCSIVLLPYLDFGFAFFLLESVLILPPYILALVFAIRGRPKGLLTAAFIILAVTGLVSVVFDIIRVVTDPYIFRAFENSAEFLCNIAIFILYILLAVCAVKRFQNRQLFKICCLVVLSFIAASLLFDIISNMRYYGLGVYPLFFWIYPISRILLQIALLLFGLEASSKYGYTFYSGGIGNTARGLELLDDKLKYGIISEEEYRRRRAAIDPTYTAADKETDDIAAVLRNLENNLKYGWITEEEYREKRAAILKSL